MNENTVAVLVTRGVITDTFRRLVPEKREEVTTEGGLDIHSQKEWITEIVATLLSKGIKTSLFIDPDSSQLEASRDTGATFVELHTGAFANAYYGREGENEAKRLETAADIGQQQGLFRGFERRPLFRRLIQRAGHLFDMVDGGRPQ